MENCIVVDIDELIGVAVVAKPSPAAGTRIGDQRSDGFDVARVKANGTVDKSSDLFETAGEAPIARAEVALSTAKVQSRDRVAIEVAARYDDSAASASWRWPVPVENLRPESAKPRLSP